jgi:hypothetical protein
MKTSKQQLSMQQTVTAYIYTQELASTNHNGLRIVVVFGRQILPVKHAKFVQPYTGRCKELDLARGGLARSGATRRRTASAKSHHFFYSGQQESGQDFSAQTSLEAQKLDYFT